MSNFDPANSNVGVNPNEPFDKMDLFVLLGLENLNEEERQQIIVTIFQEALGRTMDDIYLSTEIPESIKSAMENIANTETDPIKMQERLVEAYPPLVSEVVENTQILKVEMCLQQMKDLYSKYESKLSDLEKTSLSELINNADVSYQSNNRAQFLGFFTQYTNLVGGFVGRV